MFNNELIEVLLQLGLTPLQGKVYATLLQLPDPTAAKASKLSKIARQEIYRLTEELEEIGIVSKTVSTPVRFQPVAVTDALSILMERRIKLTSELIEKVRNISLDSEKKSEKEPQSYVIKDLPPEKDWFGNSPLKMKTTKTFDLLTSHERLGSRFAADEKIFREAAQNKRTTIRIIIDKPPTESPIWAILERLKVYSYFQMRFLDVKPEAVILIFNKKEAAVSLSPDKPVGPPYLFANHPCFLILANEYFESMWTQAKEA